MVKINQKRNQEIPLIKDVKKSPKYLKRCLELFLMKFGTFGLEFSLKKSLNVLTRKLNGKNPDWTEDRKTTTKSVQYMKIYEKVRPKLRPKYVQTTTKEDRKSF